MNNKLRTINNCNCYWDSEWHPEENVYMPDFIKCESCKCKDADKLFLLMNSEEFKQASKSEQDQILTLFNLGELND
tara:strand:- start:261 stop:488 length:228 start_codon:yes stop_codon:yes gene_type:complete